ncbi:hypothetical protein CJU89_5116 [Yarrowia sp. B02]|nr:hypothetical protein CJU89_5116 [Yarrowia sp. B02]
MPAAERQKTGSIEPSLPQLASLARRFARKTSTLINDVCETDNVFRLPEDFDKHDLEGYLSDEEASDAPLKPPPMNGDVETDSDEDFSEDEETYFPEHPLIDGRLIYIAEKHLDSVVCVLCRQVVLQKDRRSHLLKHVPNTKRMNDEIDTFLKNFSHLNDNIPSRVFVEATFLDIKPAKACTKCESTSRLRTSTSYMRYENKCRGQLEAVNIQDLGIERKRVIVDGDIFGSIYLKVGLMTESTTLADFSGHENDHWLLIAGWGVHGRRIRHHEIRRKWTSMPETGPVVQAQIDLMQQVYAYCKGEGKQLLKSEDISVPEQEERYLDIFLQL